MGKYQFIDQNGTFQIEQPETYSYLYFPLAGEQGLKSAITPNLGGDSKIDQNTFLLEPVSSENLHNNRSTRNFWCMTEQGCWSATGVSAEQEYAKFTGRMEKSCLTAGLMWQQVERENEVYGLKSKITSFVPRKDAVEIMKVMITNTKDQAQKITPVAAVPIYGRSAENIRDHRHVTSLLSQICTTEYGVCLKPTLSFDERGHQENDMIYYVYGVEGQGTKPEQFYPQVEMFVGQGGTYTSPNALKHNLDGVKAGYEVAGREAVGAIRFEEKTLQPGESATYIVLMGVHQPEALKLNKKGQALGIPQNERDEVAEIMSRYNTEEKVGTALADVKEYWQEMVNVRYSTKDEEFDQFMRWVSFQPILRRIYGCSFLPYHDYGKGGRGWRDLWQDCLALLIMNPSGVRQMILDNFGGVRIDGSNATIIGEEQGEFVADRNHIARVWMDHGMWPFLTTKLYMDQTGDIEILGEEQTYFKDGQTERGTSTDEEWDERYGCQQRTNGKKIYKGTVLEHLLLEHLCAFYEVGEHNHMRLRGADWNDALDLAPDRGESVAFTCAYAGNMRDIAEYVRAYAQKTGTKTIGLAEELNLLLQDDGELYDQIGAKKQLLNTYLKMCRHNISGRKMEVEVEQLCKNLEGKAKWIMDHVRATEWIDENEERGWFNGYYDNDGRSVEGINGNDIRMMLTGQVFAIMSNTADDEQVRKIIRSADAHLCQKERGGYCLNTDFKEKKMNLGRMFGFAYGEKENGAVFSHMAVMYANALYQRGFVKEGFKVLNCLKNSSMDFEKSTIYPGIPEYFDMEGHGMYHYLTGAASWFMLTVIREIFGVRGEKGELAFEPKLVEEQFNEQNEAGISLIFAGKNVNVTYQNPERKEAGDYKVKAVSLNGREIFKGEAAKCLIERTEWEKEKDCRFVVVLG